MSQSQIQEQLQQLKQGQTFSHQQLLQASLVELPITQLVDRITTEMNDNPALETASPGDEDDSSLEPLDTLDDPDIQEDFESRNEREERQSALDEALNNMGRDDDELPVYHGGSSVSEEREEMVYGESVSFYDQLKEQMGELDMSDTQRDVMEYLIGSLDDDGLLRKDLGAICDELAVYHNVDVTEQDLMQVLQLLQTFDPAGIGARSLQECLLLQIDRREPSRLKELMAKVVNSYFDEFTKKHWDKIQASLSLNDAQAEALFRELRKLNPRPGASLGETVGRNMQQITPDFIIDTLDDGTVTFTLNNGEVPELKVSQSFVDSMKEYQQNKDHLSRQTKEALLYIKKKVDADILLVFIVLLISCMFWFFSAPLVRYGYGYLTSIPLFVDGCLCMELVERSNDKRSLYIAFLIVFGIMGLYRLKTVGYDIISTLKQPYYLTQADYEDWPAKEYELKPGRIIYVPEQDALIGYDKFPASLMTIDIQMRGDDFKDGFRYKDYDAWLENSRSNNE